MGRTTANNRRRAQNHVAAAKLGSFRGDDARVCFVCVGGWELVAVCSTNRGQGRAEQGKGEGEQGQLSAGVCRAQRESTERVQRERESDRAGQRG